ncbi:MAG: hypothetical protein ACO3FI_05910 [Cyclobacteriaceae bacterium]
MKNREYIKAEENLKRDSEKRYQVKVKRAQEENLTQLKEKKKKKKTD